MKLSVREIVTFGMLGALMYLTKFVMEIVPNVHLLGVFTVAFSAHYRKKALYPIYVYVLINGVVSGFAMWWIPYLYLWTLLWAAVMLVPKNLSKIKATVIYVILCGLHGFLYGTLYAPAQALMYGMSFRAMIAWIITGLPWDAIHGVSNLVLGAILIAPIINILNRLERITADA